MANVNTMYAKDYGGGYGYGAAKESPYGIWPIYKPYDVEPPTGITGREPASYVKSLETMWRGGAGGGMLPETKPYPTIPDMPTYQPAGGAYPITQLPTYKPTPEAYPTYGAPETGGVTTELQESIRERMTGAGTAGAESAIYERGEDRVQIEYEEGLKRIDEQMASRGLTGSGIHGEAVEKLETERQRSLADLGRQITIYGQQAIESAMAKGQQYVAYQSAEAQRELAAGERGWAGRTQERIRGFESEARAAEAKGRSEEAAYNTAIAERVRAYEAQYRAAQAKTGAQVQKWQSEAELHMRKYQMEMEKAQMLQQAKMTAWQVGREEYQKVYESEYQATRDNYLAEQAAEEAARVKEQQEWERKRREIETRWETYYQQYKVEEHKKYAAAPAYSGMWSTTVQQGAK